MDLINFTKVGNNRQEAYDNFVDFELGFDEDVRYNYTFEEFCKELDKGYRSTESNCVQIARLYEAEDGTIWYDNEY